MESIGTLALIGDIALPFVLATAFLAVKLFNVICLARVLVSKYRIPPAASAIAAWMLVFAFQIVLILALSFASGFERWLLVAGWMTWTIALYALSLRYPKRLAEWRPDRSAVGPIGLIAVIMAVLWLRAAVFFDGTWDGQTYGLPRLILWMQAKSVLVHMEAPQVNLFANEWLAELNMAAYGVWCGDYLGFNFGNLEIMLAFAAALIWVADLSKLSPLVGSVIAAALLSTPAVVGLATVMKGDLLACVAIVIGFGWLLHLRGLGRQPVALCFLLLSLALAVGAKISTAPVAMVIALWAFGGFDFEIGLKSWRAWSAMAMIAVLASLAFLSRFILNSYIYGNPLQRVGNERAAFAWDNLVGNAQTVISHLWPRLPLSPNETWALSAGLGLSIWFMLSLAAIAALFQLREESRANMPHAAPGDSASVSARWLLAVAGSVLLATGTTMALGIPYPWTFRYFLPGLLVIFLICCSWLGKYSISKWLSAAAQTGLMVVVVLQVSAWARPGEIIPLSAEEIAPRRNLLVDTMKRVTLRFSELFNVTSLKTLGFDNAIGSSILAYQEIDSPLLPFLGGQAQNAIVLTKSPEQFLEKAADLRWDAAVVAQPAQLRPPGLRERLAALGYRILADNAIYIVAIPADRIQTSLLLGIDGLSWGRFGPAPAVDMVAADNRPDVASADLADVGVVSQPVELCGPVLIEARVSGAVSSDGAHAAHLSIYGVAPLLVFPSGQYSETRTHSTVTSMPCRPVSLAFGLGGWGQGRGQIRLSDLQIYRFGIQDAVRSSLPSSAK